MVASLTCTVFSPSTGSLGPTADGKISMSSSVVYVCTASRHSQPTLTLSPEHWLRVTCCITCKLATRSREGKMAHENEVVFYVCETVCGCDYM